MNEFAQQLHDIQTIFGLDHLADVAETLNFSLSALYTQNLDNDEQQRWQELVQLHNELIQFLQTDRIAAIARRPAEAYNGLTMLEMIQAGRALQVYQIARASQQYTEMA